MTLDLVIDPSTYTIEVWPPRTHGGQHVGTGPNGIKITHVSGLTAICENGRSQHRNREIAMNMLLAGLTHPKLQD